MKPCTNALSLVRDLHALKLSHKDIAAQTGLSKHQVANVIYNRNRGVIQRKDAGRSRYPEMEEAIEQVKALQMQQSRRKGNMTAAIDYVHEFYLNIPKATLASHVYKRAKAENWDMLWCSLKQQHGLQRYLPKMNHDYWRNVGYNDFWVIDGRKSDRWVYDSTNRRFMPQGFYIMELRTAAYLNVAFDKKAFDGRTVAQMLLKTALKYGPPNVGILCDNGMEQVGLENVDLFESFWDDEYIHACRMGHGVDGLHTIYPGAISPVVTSLPRIPTEFAKARLERSFGFMQKRADALMAGNSYQGGGREDVVHTTLNRSPRVDGTWGSYDTFINEMTWFLTAPASDLRNGIIPYAGIERPYLLKGFAEETGMRPTIGNAWEYCFQEYEPNRIPDLNYWKIVYHTLDRFDRRRVNNISQVSFTAKGTRYSFECPKLTYEWLGRYVDVALDPNDSTTAGIFDERHQFVGVAIDISRRANTGQITIASAKEMMGAVRNAALQDVRANAAPYKQQHAPLQLPDALPQPEDATAIRIEYADPLRISDTQNQNSLSGGTDEADISDDTREILARINQAF